MQVQIDQNRFVTAASPNIHNIKKKFPVVDYVTCYNVQLWNQLCTVTRCYALIILEMKRKQCFIQHSVLVDSYNIHVQPKSFVHSSH